MYASPLLRSVLCAAVALALGCKKKEEPKEPASQPVVQPAPQPAAVPKSVGQTPPPAKRNYTPEELNRLALRHNVPLFWRADKNGNGRPDPDEVSTLLFYPTREQWVVNGQFTAAFHSALESLAAADAPLTGTPEEIERKTLVRSDLDQGATTIIYNDLRKRSPSEKAFVARMFEVSTLIEALYAKLTGTAGLRASVPPDDPASQSLLRRNWGPRCAGPKTDKNPKCSAIPGSPSPIYDIYPAAMQKDPKFCKALEQHADGKALLAPFVVVREVAGKLTAVPYNVAYKAEMGAIAAKLREASSALGTTDEAPLRTYLTAAAKAFEDNDWFAADESWAAMNAKNSKWYVRVAPDETYWEPCKAKAGFHVTFALINVDSLAWQNKLEPVKQQMEDALAAHIGAPYKAQKATFKLPEFIDIVLNAGDNHRPFGGTIGQSLPNWGKVANESRGRTIAMANLYQDPRSTRERRRGAESLLTKEAMSHFSDSPNPGVLSTVLHEATHNLGPAHEYAFEGKTASQVFGGELASMWEELKAQSGALWYLRFLKDKGIITEKDVRESFVDAVTWAFGHTSRGMYDNEGRRRAYSQLAAVQLGFLMDEGVLKWGANRLAANGTDKGAFDIDHAKLPAAADKLMKQVAGIKARNDKQAAEAIAKRYVDGNVVPFAIITERLLRSPKTSFVYGFDL